MITLITGVPGAGKTSACVSLLQEMAKGRAIYVNGVTDLKVPHVELSDPHRWPELVEDGAAIVIDEVQRVWRPAGSGAKVPPDIEALETHRHRGIDFFLMTQHPSLLHAEARRLVGRHIHLRDVGVLGRWWYEWPEATNPETFKSAPIKKSYRLDKSTFALYKSASLHVKPIRSIPRSLLVVAVCIPLLAWLGWRAYSSISGKLKPAAGGVVAPGAAGSSPGAASSPRLTAAVGAGDVGPGGPAVLRPGDRVVGAVPGRVVMPPELAGCYVDQTECVCTTNEAPARILRAMGRVCVEVANGGGSVMAHPERAALVVVPDDSAFGAKARAGGGDGLPGAVGAPGGAARPSAAASVPGGPVS